MKVKEDEDNREEMELKQIQPNVSVKTLACNLDGPAAPPGAL